MQMSMGLEPLPYITMSDRCSIVGSQKCVKSMILNLSERRVGCCLPRKLNIIAASWKVMLLMN